MSRTKKAGTTVIFGYLQQCLALTSGILMLPFILSHIGMSNYGLWLASGEMMAYAALADLGVMAVLPWLIAENDGRNDQIMLRKLIANSVVLGVLVGFVILMCAWLLWPLGARVMHLSGQQYESLSGPLCVLVAGSALGFPLRTFVAVLAGLQDVRFTGTLNLAQSALSITLTAVLLSKGWGFYALALAAVLPPLLVAVAALSRLGWTSPALIFPPARPSLPVLKYLFSQGFGPWLAGFGWRMIAASNNLILVSLGSPGAAVVFTCTAKMGDLLMPMAWQLPDSGLVGLAQLHGEGRRERVREVVLTLLRMTLLTSGCVVLAILFFNPSFVHFWVGSEKFGGYGLNALLAATCLSHSLIHGLIVPPATLGNRFRIGLITLLQGAVNFGVAMVLGHWFGTLGVAAAVSVSTVFVALPLALRMLSLTLDLSVAEIWHEALWPAFRMGPLLLGAAFMGPFVAKLSLPGAAMASGLIGLVFLWWMRPLMAGLPLPGALRVWLGRLRLAPHA